MCRFSPHFFTAPGGPFILIQSKDEELSNTFFRYACTSTSKSEENIYRHSPTLSPNWGPGQGPAR